MRPGGYSDSEEDSDSDFGLEASPSGTRVTGQADDPGHHIEEVEKEEKISRSVLSDLTQSVEAGDLETVRQLLEGEAVPVNTNLAVWSWGELTPAGLAALHAQHEVLQFLLERGANCAGEGFLLLATAGWEGPEGDHEKLINCAELINKLDNEDLNMRQSQGQTPLMIASKNGNRPLVRWMIEHGAKLDLLDRMFWSALMFSVDSGHGDVARLLLDSGADPNLVNKNGQTAADLAAIRERDGGGLQDIIRSFTEVEGREVEKQNNYSIREVTHMEKALTNAGLSHLYQHIVNHKIDLETFLLLREEDMMRLGVEEVGDVKRLLICQAELHKEEWRSCSLPSLTAQKGWEGLMINMVTAINMVANISQHARLMDKNVQYIRQQLNDHNQRLLSTGSDLVSPEKLQQQLKAASSHIGNLRMEVNSLSKQLSKFKVSKEPSPNRYLTIKNFGIISVLLGTVSTVYLYTKSK